MIRLHLESAKLTVRIVFPQKAAIQIDQDHHETPLSAIKLVTVLVPFMETHRAQCTLLVLFVTVAMERETTTPDFGP